MSWLYDLAARIVGVDDTLSAAPAESEIDALRAELSKLQHDHQRLAKAAGIANFAGMAVPPVAGKREPADWQMDRNEFVKHYRNSVYIAVGAVAKKCAMQGCHVERLSIVDGQERWDPVEYNHPLRVLFREVNQIDTTWDLWFYTIAWRLVCGNSFLWKARNGFRTPVELWSIPPQWVHAVPSTERFIDHYTVKGFFGANPTPIDADDIIHMREPNLDWSGTGRYYGWPQLAAAATPVDLEEAMYTRLYHAFKNYAPPGEKFYTDEELTDDQLKEIYRQIVGQHRVAEQYGRPMVTHSGLKPHGTQTVRELDYARSLDVTLEKVLAIFGVPKAVVGLVKDSNRANMQAALMSFSDNTINPLLEHTGQHLTQGLASDFGSDLRIRFEPSTVDDIETMHDAMRIGLDAKALTPDEVREELFGMKPYKNGGGRPIGSDNRPLPIGNEDIPEHELNPQPNGKTQAELPFANTDDESEDDEELDGLDKILIEEMRSDARWVDRINKALSENGWNRDDTSHAGRQSSNGKVNRLNGTC